MLFNSISPIQAEMVKKENEYFNSFKNVVYNSNSYEKNKNSIESVFVERIVNTDEGIRSTIVFNLIPQNGHQRQLIYVGDSSNRILLNSLVTYFDDSYSTINLQNNVTTTVQLGERGAAYICFTKVCQAFRPSFASNPACAQTVGLGCSNSSLSKKSISKIACQLSVWTVCKVLINRACTSYYEIQDVCTF